ncbi:hypothetical protein SeMB42_g04734 [Synchytrium endobioticum]|uniref:F-box domain-containing protein n=1 Tax=Synchytrium endobioticum TaxID=286115 RepID=A0A507CW88_9FUNG|nr:hypothetical protein SeMB42_g04734 [Synchytrium endobioticum]TPX44311.1 hypothetical protein SeLEV6574_g04582 [Synchytrium endobioticum]
MIFDSIFSQYWPQFDAIEDATMPEAAHAEVSDNDQEMISGKQEQAPQEREGLERPKVPLAAVDSDSRKEKIDILEDHFWLNILACLDPTSLIRAQRTCRKFHILVSENEEDLWNVIRHPILSSSQIFSISLKTAIELVHAKACEMCMDGAAKMVWPFRSRLCQACVKKCSRSKKLLMEEDGLTEDIFYGIPPVKIPEGGVAYLLDDVQTAIADRGASLQGNTHDVWRAEWVEKGKQIALEIARLEKMEADYVAKNTESSSKPNTQACQDYLGRGDIRQLQNSTREALRKSREDVRNRNINSISGNKGRISNSRASALPTDTSEQEMFGGGRSSGDGSGSDSTSAGSGRGTLSVFTSSKSTFSSWVDKGIKKPRARLRGKSTLSAAHVESDCESTNGDTALPPPEVSKPLKVSQHETVKVGPPANSVGPVFPSPQSSSPWAISLRPQPRRSVSTTASSSKAQSVSATKTLSDGIYTAVENLQNGNITSKSVNDDAVGAAAEAARHDSCNKKRVRSTEEELVRETVQSLGRAKKAVKSTHSGWHLASSVVSCLANDVIDIDSSPSSDDDDDCIMIDDGTDSNSGSCHRGENQTKMKHASTSTDSSDDYFVRMPIPINKALRRTGSPPTIAGQDDGGLENRMELDKDKKRDLCKRDNLAAYNNPHLLLHPNADLNPNRGDMSNIIQQERNKQIASIRKEKVILPRRLKFLEQVNEYEDSFDSPSADEVVDCPPHSDILVLPEVIELLESDAPLPHPSDNRAWEKLILRLLTPIMSFNKRSRQGMYERLGLPVDGNVARLLAYTCNACAFAAVLDYAEMFHHVKYHHYGDRHSCIELSQPAPRVHPRHTIVSNRPLML